MDKFKVAIRYNDQYGRIEYNPDTKEVTVLHPDETACREAMAYLTTRKKIRTAQDDLLNFIELDMLPTDNVENLKLALTRMWEKNEVFVDWSRPVA